MRYRGAVPPLVLILAATAGTLSCDTEARRRARAEEARRTQEWEDAQRRDAELSAPTPETLGQVREATDAFMAEHHPDLAVEGTSLTSLTPNLFLVGVDVKDLLHENRYTAQLTAERLRDGEWDGGFKENGRLLWVVDYATPDRLRELGQRHGIQEEVDRVANQDRDGHVHPTWGHRTWLDDYLLWHYVFHRPAAYHAPAGGAFEAMPRGYRFPDPARPIQPQDGEAFQAAAAPTGGRSVVFLGGGAWRPPSLGTVHTLPGQAFLAGAGGHVAGRAAMGAVGRGGFGAAGHAAGTGG